MLRIKIERERAGLTRTRLAALADLHPADYGKFEAGRLKPYPAQLARLARVLGVPGDLLFKEAPPDEQQSSKP